MTALKSFLKYAGYYVIACMIISIFVSPAWRGFLTALSGAAMAVSWFAMVINLILGENSSKVCEKLEYWCLRGTFIVVGLAAAIGISTGAIGNFLEKFSGA